MHNQHLPTSWTPSTPSLNKPSLTRRGALPLPVVAMLLLTTTFSVGFVQAQTPPATTAKTQVVEVKDDRFSGKRTVVLKDLRLSDNLTLSLQCEIKTAARPQDLSAQVEEQLQPITVEFSVPASTSNPFTGQMEVNFLVDGRREHGGVAGDGTVVDSMRRDGRRTALGVLSLEALRNVVRGKRVEMKIGELEVTLDERVLKNLRAFVVAATR